MILVTVGMHTDGFVRLINAMDDIAVDCNEEIVMQIGASAYQPRAARWFTFDTQQAMEELCERARIIVCHAGAGSILTALRYNKPVVVMPRLHKYGEHVDNHQLELAEALSEAGMLLVAQEATDLRARLKDADGFVPKTSNSDRLVQSVRQAILNGAK